jgi:hypothetical protein
MPHFIIQKQDKLPAYGFCFETIKSIDFLNWCGSKPEYTYTLMTLAQLKTYMPKTTQKKIPIGSVEFVHEYMRLHNIPTPKPLNVPEPLFPLCSQRPVNIITPTYIKGDRYIKSNDLIKHSGNGYKALSMHLVDGSWQVTNPLSIEAEWRCFIFKNKLIDAKCYTGDCLKAPHLDYINRCIDTYTNAPIAYTLDIGIHMFGNTVIEVHDMYSCGFYGFEGKYPALMQAAWWKEYLKKCII